MLTNFGWVRRGEVAGMGRPSPGAWAILRQEGIGAVLSLTEVPPPGDPLAAGLECLHVPIRDFGTPSPADLRRCLQWMQDQVADGRAVVVHCHAGIGRTGMLLAAYLVVAGESAEDAIHRVRAMRPGSIETRAQIDVVRTLETYLRKHPWPQRPSAEEE